MAMLNAANRLTLKLNQVDTTLLTAKSTALALMTIMCYLIPVTALSSFTTS